VDRSAGSAAKPDCKRGEDADEQRKPDLCDPRRRNQEENVAIDELRWPANCDAKPDVIKHIPEGEYPEERGDSFIEVAPHQRADCVEHDHGRCFSEAFDSEQALSERRKCS